MIQNILLVNYHDNIISRNLKKGGSLRLYVGARSPPFFNRLPTHFLLEPKLSTENREVCLSQLKKIANELFDEGKQDSKSTTNSSLTRSSNVGQSFQYMYLQIDQNELSLNQYIESYPPCIHSWDHEKSFKLLDHLHTLSVWPKESLKKIFGNVIADDDAIELSQLKAYAAALGRSFHSWPVDNFDEKLNRFKTLINTAGGQSLDFSTRLFILNTFITSFRSMDTYV